MWETLNIIEQMDVWRPRVVIWENVKGVLGKRMRANYARYLDWMKTLGYTTSFEVLDARDFGLPQNRQRVFTISQLGGQTFDFDKLETRPMVSIGNFLEDASSSYTITAPSILNKLPNADIESKFKGRLQVIDRWCWTITTKQCRNPNSGVIDLHNGQFRILTELECWLLQGYSYGDYMAAATVNSKTALYKQAGNSIPVPIFESIFKQILG